MNPRRLETLLKQANPRFRVRQRGLNHIGGIFLGSSFIATFTKGHIPLNSYRLVFKKKDTLGEKIIKRGRGDLLQILVRRGILKRLDSIRIKWGIDAKD
jgi:hypothetical protein